MRKFAREAIWESQFNLHNRDDYHLPHCPRPRIKRHQNSHADPTADYFYGARTKYTTEDYGLGTPPSRARCLRARLSFKGES